MAYPYVMSPDRLKGLLTKMAKEVGVPNKFDTKFLKSVGYTGGNDTRMLGAIKFVGLADDRGTPTDLWKELRANPKKALAKGVRQGYADLFSHYPDANVKDDEALRTFFSAHTDLGAQAIAKTVRTFKTFCELGDFDAAESASPIESNVKSNRGAGSPTRTPAVETRRFSDGLVVNINVQLQVPPDATGEIYDKFFEAMRKHLWPSQK